MPHHRKIVVIRCNFKRFNNFLNGENLLNLIPGFFFKENVRYPVCTCRDPIYLILGARFSLTLGTR